MEALNNESILDDAKRFWSSRTRKLLFLIIFSLALPAYDIGTDYLYYFDVLREAENMESLALAYLILVLGVSSVIFLLLTLPLHIGEFVALIKGKDQFGPDWIAALNKALSALLENLPSSVIVLLSILQDRNCGYVVSLTYNSATLLSVSGTIIGAVISLGHLGLELFKGKLIWKKIMLSLAMIGAIGTIGVSITNAAYLSDLETLAEKGGCTRFQLTFSSRMAFPVLHNSSDFNDTEIDKHLNFEYFTIRNSVDRTADHFELFKSLSIYPPATFEFLERNRLTLTAYCNELFPVEFYSMALANPTDNCTFFASSTYSTKTFKPEFNIGYLISKSIIFSSCVKSFLAKNGTYSVPYFTSEATVQWVGSEFCSSKHSESNETQTFGCCQMEDCFSSGVIGLPMIDCANNCYKWVPQDNPPPLVFEEFEGSLYQNSNGMNYTMKYNVDVPTYCHVGPEFMANGN